MVNMSRILFPCIQPTNMMTPETQSRKQTGRHEVETAMVTKDGRGRRKQQTYDAEGIERELLPQQVHALLQGCFRSLSEADRKQPNGSSVDVNTESLINQHIDF